MEQVATQRIVDTGDVDAVLVQLTEELSSLLRQRNEVMRKIGKAKKTIAGLLTLCGVDARNEKALELSKTRVSRRTGLSEECRLVLMNADRPLGAREICERVCARLPSLNNNRRPLASITTILNRLVKYGEAFSLISQNGRHKWAWAAEEGKPVGHSSMSLSG
jgi:chorismate mutase